MPAVTARLLVATADDGLARELGALLFELGLTARRATSFAEACERLESGVDDVFVADLSLPDLKSADLAGLMEERGVELPLIVVVDASSPAQGIAAVRAGASDFVRKPLDREELSYVINKALKSAEAGADEPPRSVAAPPLENPMIGASRPMAELYRTLRKAADGVATVLVRGESGSGKELVARQVHALSPRRNGPFVKVHCAALPENLLESELFGYEKGAFTGATARKPGRVELAEAGTLFLDEIGDITPATQVKLLRVLQDRQYERLGGNQTLAADVRFVAATHRDLEAMVRAGTFREDLFYRLNVVSLVVPPLRARPEDIEPLALHFCQSVSAANKRGPAALDVDALERLRKEPWPGNVRQLQNFIERLVVLASRPRISLADVERELARHAGALGFAEASGYAPQVTQDSSVMDLGKALRKAEKRAIE
jgi:two-component system, NtrC family, response regulator AtoC